MGFWIFVTACTFAVPVVMIIIGKIFKNGRPRDINNISGFRTALSMKSKAAWRFANSYCGALWFKYGFVLLPINVAVMCLTINKSADDMSVCSLLLCAADIIVMIIAVVSTQKELKRRFDEYGNPVSTKIKVDGSIKANGVK